MAQYDDLYLRMSLTDTGTIPRLVTAGTSPDVIPYGNETVLDPQTFFTANYDSYVDKPLLTGTGETNNIYVRVKNYFTEGTTGKIYLYYAFNNQLDSPRVWKKNVIRTASGADYIEVTAEASGDIAVTAEPFVWAPPALPAGQSYNLIARVSTVRNPNPVPTTIASFTAYVGDNGGIGWETPTLPPPVVKPVWTTSFPYAQGDTERTMYFMLEGENITIGSQVSISSDTGVIKMDKAPVTTSPFSVGINQIVPAGYTCNLSFTLWNQQKDSQPADSYVKLRVFYKEKPVSGPSKEITVMWAKTNN